MCVCVYTHTHIHMSLLLYLAWNRWFSREIQPNVTTGNSVYNFFFPQITHYVLNF